MGQIWPIREGPLTQVDLEPTWGGAPNPSRHRVGAAAALGLAHPMWGPTQGGPSPLPLAYIRREPPPLIHTLWPFASPLSPSPPRGALKFRALTGVEEFSNARRCAAGFVPDLLLPLLYWNLSRETSSHRTCVELRGAAPSTCLSSLCTTTRP